MKYLNSALVWLVVCSVMVGAQDNDKVKDHGLKFMLKVGQLEKIKVLIKEEPALVKELTKKDYPFLEHVMVADKNRVEIVKLLFENGLDLNKPKDHGNRALWYACGYDITDLVAILLIRGVDINVVDVEKQTCLHTAARSNSLNVMKLLLAQKGEDGNLVAKLNELDRWKETPLICGLNYASRMVLRKKVVKDDTYLQLIEAGADVKVANKKGDTALHYAAKCKLTKTAEALIKKGADVNVMNKRKQTPLWFAVAYEALDVAKVLLKNGAEVDKMAMEEAESEDNNDMIDLLDKYAK